MSILKPSPEQLKEYTKIDLRQVANRKIVNELIRMVEKYPNLRFNQLITVMGIVEEKTVDGKRVIECDWNTESVDTLEMLKKNPFCYPPNKTEDI